MSDNFEDDEIEEQDEVDTEDAKGGDEEVMVLLKRMQQQLAFLEKKIDTLLSQSSQQPSQGSDRPRYGSDRGFSRPPRPFGNSYGGGGGRDRGPSRDRGGDYPPRGRSFDRPPRRDDSRGGSGGGMGGGGGGFNREKKKFFRGDRK